MNRSQSPKLQGVLDKIQWWKDYVAMYGGQIDNNPSVGNKAGGLTTITEVIKCGLEECNTALEEVYQYADQSQNLGWSLWTLLDSTRQV